MTISLATVTYLAASILNATPTAYGTFDAAADPLHPQAELNDAALTADHQIISAILDNPDHRFRKSFISLVTVTNGQAINQNVEGGVIIDGRPGKQVTPAVLAKMEVNPNSLATVTGYYCFQGNNPIIFFTGTVCQVDVTNYVPTSNLQAPDEYEMAVVAGILAQVFPKEGTNVAAATYYGNMYLEMLKMIGAGRTAVPTVTSFKQE